MGFVDYHSLAGSIVHGVGGEENIISATHCATRLRLRLRDDTIADTAALKALPGVLTVMQAGGQYQVVIGNNVPEVYAELGRITTLSDAGPEADGAPRGSLFNRFVDLVSSIFQPMLWPLAGAGLFKAFLAAATEFGWLDKASQTHTILAAAADSIFYFMPMFLAITAARRFKTNEFTSMAIAAALLYPTIVELADTDGVRFLGLPVVTMSYTSSVIPIIVAVWLQGYLERFLTGRLPSAVRNFTTPLLTILVMVPLVLMTVGPITTYAAEGLSSGVRAIFDFAPWVAGGLMGGLWQVFVLFGLHWGFIPFMASDIATSGHSLLLGPLPAAVLAQAGATLAVFLRTRSASRREVAGPASISGFLAGVTEPAIYGVNLPLRTPFYFGIAGGTVGGAIAASGGSAATAFVLPSALGLSAYTGVGSFALQLVGTGMAVAIAFTLTWFFGPRETEDAATKTVPSATLADATVPDPTGTLNVTAPVSGRAVDLADVADKVFASGALGGGVGIVPTDGHIYAPVSGTVIAAMKAGHAYGIKSPEGVEVLVHVGIDTVQLAGRGFRPVVERGQVVQSGDLLAEVDLDVVAEAGFDPTTLVVVMNTAQLSSVDAVPAGILRHGERAITVQV